MSDPSRELKFPVNWRYRIVTESKVEDCCAMLQAVLNRYDSGAVLEESRGSSGGKYRTYVADVCFDSREMMESLSADLAAVPGVKFML